MKKHLLILVLACVLINVKSVQSQTCVDAIPAKIDNSVYFPSIFIPSPGTISPGGPSLGCLTVTQRQVWFYLPVCYNYYLWQCQAYIDSTLQNDTIGVILYGPFSEKVTNCADLNSTKLIACAEYSTQGAQQFPLNVMDTLYEGNYYYFLVTFSDGYSGTRILSTPFYGPIPLAFNDCFECNSKPSVLHSNRNNICIVTVDTAINRCKIIYDELTAPNLAGYEILRESNLAGVYDTIASIPIGSLSEYTDATSSPVQRSYTYAVVGYDSCGNTMTQQKSLTTIHLLSYAGTNNVAQLSWNNIYDIGAGFEPQYFIYRNNAATGWQLIDSIGITLPTITYTDIFAPAGINSYTVELRKTVACVPMLVQTYQSVFSNVTDVIVTGIEELGNNSIIQVFPNPANTSFTFSINSTTNESVEIRIYNTLGSQVYFSKEETVTGKFSKQINVENFSNGIYFLQVKTKEGVASKKVVVGH